jgi:hypothetical protein
MRRFLLPSLLSGATKTEDDEMFSSSKVFAIEGKSYLPEAVSSSSSSSECVCEGFEEQCKSLLWFTYRSGFPEIQPSAKTSDAGWGCMLRSESLHFRIFLILSSFHSPLSLQSIQPSSHSSTQQQKRWSNDDCSRFTTPLFWSWLETAKTVDSTSSILL